MTTPIHPEIEDTPQDDSVPMGFDAVREDLENTRTELRETQRAVQSQGFLIAAFQEHIAAMTVDLANARAELAMTRAARQ